MKKSPSSSSATPLWVQLYFVLSSLLGLILTAIGTISLVNVVLTQSVFMVPKRPMSPPPYPAVLEKSTTLTDTKGLTQEQKDQLVQWQADYSTWQESDRNYDYEKAERQRSLANGVAMLIAGLPILFFHAPWVFRKAQQS